ncbi:heme-binding protein [Inquilinus sp.]|jgi:hypothetical protein|uniref:heme-binding protein n=1 Tax=Inquilinus sp. TaxID=1932117 RepID=UPI0037833C6F
MSKPSLIQHSRQLTYTAAAIAIEAAVAKSRELAAPECIAVVDAGANLLAFARVDGAAVLARDPAILRSPRPPPAPRWQPPPVGSPSNSGPVSDSPATALS